MPDLRAGVQEDDVRATAGEVVAEGQAGLPGADDDDVDQLAIAGGRGGGHGISRGVGGEERGGGDYGEPTVSSAVATIRSATRQVSAYQRGTTRPVRWWATSHAAWASQPAAST